MWWGPSTTRRYIYISIALIQGRSRLRVEKVKREQRGLWYTLQSFFKSRTYSWSLSHWIWMIYAAEYDGPLYSIITYNRMSVVSKRICSCFVWNDFSEGHFLDANVYDDGARLTPRRVTMEGREDGTSSCSPPLSLAVADIDREDQWNSVVAN